MVILGMVYYGFNHIIPMIVWYAGVLRREHFRWLEAEPWSFSDLFSVPKSVENNRVFNDDLMEFNCDL